MTRLPIDDQLPKIAASLSENSQLVLEAPPGAGKTTRVPPLLLDQPWCKGLVLVSEPRRIAARLSARRVAAEQGGPVGHRVGYRVRFDDKTSAQTRLIYMTEGLLLRFILDDPKLRGVSAVVLDEVHERSADLDALLALLTLISERRHDLRIVYMSATLDASELIGHLSAPAHHRSEGRNFNVEVSYLPKSDERPLSIQVRGAVRKALAFEGDILVFLPGAREMSDCEDALKELSQLDVVTLHGDLPVDQQARAISKSNERQRVVLSTNIAESSLTIPDVTTVVDTGLARTAVFDPWSGVSRLETVSISKARCIQRAGRAGRTAPGRAYRLFTQGQFHARPDQDTPELLRSDLSDIFLRLKNSTISSDLRLEDLNWLSRPDPQKWKQARELLILLGALECDRVTETGRAMVALPLPPRLARVAVESYRLGVEETGCQATALLAERDIIRTSRHLRGEPDIVAGDSDLEDRIELLQRMKEARFDRRLASDLNVDLHSVRQVSRVAETVERTLSNHMRGKRQSDGERNGGERLTLALLAGFSDRVASRRGASRDLVLFNGLQATLSHRSTVVSAPLLLALAADAPGGRSRRPLVRVACRLEADWLMEVRADEIEAVDEHVWNAEKERVDALSRLVFGKVTLDESRAEATPCSQAADVLAQAAMQKGPAVYDPESRLETLLARLNLLLKHIPELSLSLDEGSLSTIESWLASPSEFALQAIREAARICTSLIELKRIPLSNSLVAALPPSLQRALCNHAPLEVQLTGGRRLRVHYERGRDAWAESRLQDFFSMNETPLLFRGRVPLQLHLLAPNKRAVQVTTDLSGFWTRHYPDLRKQLMRRYPKHLWPEDGRTASPPQPGKIR